MKKFISKLWILMMVAAMCFSMAACGKTEDDTDKDDDRKTVLSDRDKKDKDDEDKDSKDIEDKDSKDNEDKDDDKGSSVSGKPTLEDYLNNASVQAQFDSLKQSLSGNGMNIDIKAEGDSLIYIYQFEDMEKSDELAASLESEIAKQDTTFQTTADSLKPSVSNENLKVVIRYIDKNGAEIFSKEYVAK